MSELSSLSFAAYHWTSHRELFVSVVHLYMNRIMWKLLDTKCLSFCEIAGWQWQRSVCGRFSTTFVGNGSRLSPLHCSAAVITLCIRGTCAIRRGVKVRSGTVQAVRLWRLFWKSTSGGIAAKSLHGRGRIICGGRINGTPNDHGPVYRVDRKRRSNSFENYLDEV